MKQPSNHSIYNLLENSFAAAGLAEGDRDIARDFLANEPTGTLWTKIKVAYAKCHCYFVAAALAEECQDTARRYMKQNLDYSKTSFMVGVASKIKQWLHHLEHTFAVAGMAEGDPDMALAYHDAKLSTKTSPKPSFKQFLVTTGLKDVKFRYAFASI